MAVAMDDSQPTITKKRKSRKRVRPDSNNDTTAIEKTKKAKNPPVICPLYGCGMKGHKTAISKFCKRNPNHPEYDPNLVPPPTGKFSACLHTAKIHQKTFKLLT